MKNNAWRLDQKFAVVTGGSEGIGLATAQELVDLGAKVLIVARSHEKLIKAQIQLNNSVDILSADLTTVAGRSALTKKISEVGRLDILINNLGKADRDSFLSMSEERARQMFEFNLWSASEIMRSVYPLLKEARGTIVNLSSVAAHKMLPDRMWYGAAKAALDFTTRSLAAEWGKEGIRVNSVSPWFTLTPLTSFVLENPEMNEKIKEVTPLGRYAEASEVAKAVAFLALPASSYINGADLLVDGGYLASGRI